VQLPGLPLRVGPTRRNEVGLDRHHRGRRHPRQRNALSGRCLGLERITSATNRGSRRPLGEKDKAFLWLDKAYAGRSSFMTTLKYWSVFDPIRSDPRFSDLVRRVGLPL
jgi:hypothetical protein